MAEASIPEAREHRVQAGDVELAVVEAGDPMRPTLDRKSVV